MMNKALYNLTMQNVITVGDKKFAYIPMELLFADRRFQRLGAKAKKKAKKLAVKWDPKKMDPIRVVPHPETGTFSVIDGWHRYTAADMLGNEYIVCEIIEINGTVEERTIEEARLFATQGDETDSLSPIEKHKANLLLGVYENVKLRELADKYGIIIDDEHERSAKAKNYLTGFYRALRLIKTDSEAMDYVFNIIVTAGWNLASNGLGNVSLTTLYNIIRMHREYATYITKFLGNYLRGKDPDVFFGASGEKYPERKEEERVTLYIEDIVTENLGIERVYNGGKVA